MPRPSGCVFCGIQMELSQFGFMGKTICGRCLKDLKELLGVTAIHTIYDVGLTPHFIARMQALRIILRLLKKREDKRINHHQVVGSAKKILPVIYEEFFKEEYRDKLVTEVNQAEFVIKLNDQALQVIRIEDDLDELKEQMLIDKSRTSSILVGSRNVGIVTLVEDERFKRICKQELVRYLPLDKLTGKLLLERKKLLNKIARRVGV